MTAGSYQRHRDNRTGFGARTTLEARLDDIVRESVDEVLQNAKKIIEAGKLKDAKPQKGKARHGADAHP